jgi:hypothetical protein
MKIQALSPALGPFLVEQPEGWCGSGSGQCNAGHENFNNLNETSKHSKRRL